MSALPEDRTPPTRQSFWAKNIGPVDRMVRAILGVLLMAVGFLVFDAQKVNGPGLIFVLLGFLVFLQAPLSWCPFCALRGKCTFERSPEVQDAASAPAPSGRDVQHTRRS